MKIRYFIKPRAKDKSKEVKVYISLRDNKFRKEIATALQVKPDWWNPNTECTKNNGTVPYRSEKEKYLSGLRELIESRKELIINESCDLKKLIREFSTGVKDNDGFWGQWDSFIAYKEQHVSESRINKFNALKAILKEYESIGTPLSWSVFTADWYDEFVRFCIAKGKQVNTIWTYGMALKAYLNYALKVGWHKNVAFKEIKPVEEATPQFALSLSELELLEAYEPKLNRLSQVRDAFLVGCYTGARFQDWGKFKLSDIQEHEGISFIRYTQSKTNETVSVPVHSKLMELLKRRPSGIPMMSNQKTNDNLKMVAFEAGLKKVVQRGSEKAPLYELISTHVARRTAATIMVDRGVDYKTVMKLTGHKKIETFLKYIRKDENSHLMTISKAFEW